MVPIDSINFENFNQLMANHKKWLESNGVAGERLVVVGADISAIDASHWDLSHSVWIQCYGEDFRAGHAKFNEAIFVDCEFFDSWFVGTDFTDARFLFNSFGLCKFGWAEFKGALITSTEFHKCDGLESIPYLKK